MHISKQGGGVPWCRRAPVTPLTGRFGPCPAGHHQTGYFFFKVRMMTHTDSPMLIPSRI
nr:MAG TPA: hypothetical protein [Caudoviricetes sp.]